ncbi:MAG: MarR family winged helix-turn-helix transcriptional regulator [Candidatus Nanopelagicales bacterium]|jgi:DNA-binding MarR family transcriptional regulator
MTRWLTDDQQLAWRAWIAASLLLPDRLSRDLQDEAGISLADYEILVHLSESPQRRLRMSELADLTLSSRSRLSHQIDRMSNAGLVDRQPCSEDRRGSFAVLTQDGYDFLVTTAPAHVASVRAHLVDVLTPEEFDVLGRICTKVADRLRPTAPGSGDDEG